MKLRNMTVAAVAIAAALTMTACSSSETETPKTTTKTTTAAPETTSVALPSAADLNALLVKGLDESVPVAERANLVEGAEADPELMNQVAAAAKAANATVEILDPVIDTGSDTASASLNIIVNGQPLGQGAQASFVYSDGVWKLSKTTACAILPVANLTSPACA
ncbi:hypothetical protein [Rhodococcus sp. ARC_M6]|uniref:hypothetical protein n=1 Tax=Rhodococcus sp. ARC_M6 TaxID=2928852 RepID=UPI001FB3CEC4|nr:hypothetical protein [Rhodococcus sp. ARC_M6]MCJ0903744.1 hypothetical protein [Rhodococcus sp. ARC_M6]